MNCLIMSIIDLTDLNKLRQVDPLTQKVEKEMTNFGLFANRTQPTCISTPPSGLQFSSTLQGGENITQNYIRKVDRVVSVADECVSASIKSKLVWPQSRLKLSHANKKN